MNEIFTVHLATRQRIADLLEKHSDEELQLVPTGFANNLIWNAAHAVVTQHLLTYNLCGMHMAIPQTLVDRFRKGTKADAPVSAQDVAEVKSLLISTHTSFKADYEQGAFKNFKQYQTSYGVMLNTVEEAIAFNNTHEGLHLGYMMALRKSI